MALKIPGAKTLAVLLATAAVAAISLGAPEANAQPRRNVNVEGSQTYDGPPRKPQNYSYKSGRTRVYITPPFVARCRY